MNKQKTKKPDLSLKGLILLPILATTVFTASCDDLTRFQQERYECDYNPEGLIEIDIRNFTKGAKTSVLFENLSLGMSIIEINEKRLTLSSPGLLIRVDRISEIIRLTRGTQYRNIQCKKYRFRM